MRHIVLCVSISTNELKTVSSALEREMRHIVLSVSISKNVLTSLSSSLERELRTFLIIGDRIETLFYVCLFLRVNLRPFLQLWREK